MNWLARAVKRGIEATPCSRDHCTPEERAVIEAAIEWKTTYEFIGNEMFRTRLFHAIDNLLTAKTGTEEQ